MDAAHLTPACAVTVALMMSTSVSGNMIGGLAFYATHIRTAPKLVFSTAKR